MYKSMYVRMNTYCRLLVSELFLNPPLNQYTVPPFPSRHLRPQRESESTAPKASVMRQANSSQPVHTITGNAPVAQILDGI